MLVLNFPGNPTTQCVELDFFEEVIAIASEHGIWVVHDLAYADIVFDGYKAPSILQVPGAEEIAVEFFSLSKSYNMPGWRVGFMCGNGTLVAALARIKSYLDYGMFTPIQVAAIAALEGPQECVREIAERYQSRRDVLCEGLTSAGWRIEKPKATMFVWAPIPDALSRDGVAGVLQEAALGGQGRRVARDWVRRVRRRSRALRADRERAPHAPGRARHSRHAAAGPRALMRPYDKAFT